MQSRIETNPDTGRKSLIVFYDTESDDFDEAIKQAFAFHNIRDDKMNIIALPENSNCRGLL
jgi:hypothetical protein